MLYRFLFLIFLLWPTLSYGNNRELYYVKDALWQCEAIDSYDIKNGKIVRLEKDIMRQPFTFDTKTGIFRQASFTTEFKILERGYKIVDENNKVTKGNSLQAIRYAHDGGYVAILEIYLYEDTPNFFFVFATSHITGTCKQL